MHAQIIHTQLIHTRTSAKHMPCLNTCQIQVKTGHKRINRALNTRNKTAECCLAANTAIKVTIIAGRLNFAEALYSVEESEA